MADAIYETETRRQIQHEYNVLHGITPRTIISSIKEVSIPRKKTEAFAGGEMSRENI
jgi:excinuclease UvrABC helicase subunit UvrB